MVNDAMFQMVQRCNVSLLITILTLRMVPVWFDLMRLGFQV